MDRLGLVCDIPFFELISLAHFFLRTLGAEFSYQGMLLDIHPVSDHFARRQDDIFEKSIFEDFITRNLRVAIADDTELPGPSNFAYRQPWTLPPWSRCGVIRRRRF